jgi:hypothetical protein
MAGRIQLTTKGVQDIYFTEEPDYSHFVQLFKKHTNYTTQFVKLDVDGDPEFGKTVRLTIPKDQGDLIKTISLDVELNPIAEAEITRTGYIESIGHAMIEYVDMYIGDEKIQHIPSDYLQIYSEHNYTQTKQKALEKLIGKYPDRTSNVPVASGVILGHLGPATTSRKLFIDIPFYFYQKPELAIPLCAMCYQEVTIEIKFREIEDCVVKTDPPVDDTVQTVTLDYEVESSEVLTSNIMVVSNDGLSFASNVNNSIEITGKTTFVGDGIVSPALNVIVNSSGIYRYEDDQWVQRSTDSVSGDVQFSDDGNVVAQIGHGLWEWNGNGYDFRSIGNLVAISRSGNVYAIENISTIDVNSISTDTKLGNSIFKDDVNATFTFAFSYDGSILFISRGDSILVYTYTDSWNRLGQDINLYETGELSVTKSGTSFFVYNVNELYNNTLTGVGILYNYNTLTTQWLEVYRYQGSNGIYSSVNDANTILTIKKAPDETDYIKLQQITRSVENYDDVVIKGVEDIVDTGSRVYGVGYQALGLDTREAFLFNKDTKYIDDTNSFLDGPIRDIYINNSGLFITTVIPTLNQVQFFTRSVTGRTFVERRIRNEQGILNIFGRGDIDVNKIVFSNLGYYFAIIDTTNDNIYVFQYDNNNPGEYRNVMYVDSDTPNVYTPIPGITSKSDAFFSDDDTEFVVFGDTIQRHKIENIQNVYQTIEENTFTFPIYAVSHDLNRFIKYDSTNEIIRIFTVTENGIVSSLPISTLSNVLGFSLSKDGTIAAFVTSTFTYIYEYDGSGWNNKSSLFVGLETFKKFNMTDDGNTLSYVSSESTPDRTIIRIYTYEDLTWKRILQENDTSTSQTGGVGDVSRNGYHYIHVFNSNVNFPNRSVRAKQIIKQTETIIVNVDQEFSRLFPNQIKSCKVCLEMAFLDEYERTFIKKHAKDYVITQLQQGTYTIPKSIESHKIRTQFVNPVKELYFVIRRVNNKGYEDFVSPFDYDNDRITSENKLIFYENLKSLELSLNDTPVLDKDTGNFVFLKSIQPAIHHSKTPLIRRFYSYSFACEPEQAQPTGQVNFSLINNQLITANVTENTTYDRTLHVYALSYNILRLDKGMMRMIFNT